MPLPGQPLISVITPAHNGQARIARAVKSILQQDYAHWEMVIVSDDLTDYERHLADQGCRDNRIRFYTTGQRGSGAAYTRNIGMNVAKGDVIALLDCDDAFHPQRLSSMLPLVRSYGAAVSNLKMIHETTMLEIPNISLMVADERLLPDQVFLRFFHGQNIAMFDRNVVTHRYATVPRYEDNIFLMQMYNHVDVIGYLHEPYYHYYKYEGASTSFAEDKDVAAVFLNTAADIKRDILNGKIHFKSDELKRIMCEAMDCAVQSQRYFIEESRKRPGIKYKDVMGVFVQSCPLPRSLRGFAGK